MAIHRRHMTVLWVVVCLAAGLLYIELQKQIRRKPEPTAPRLQTAEMQIIQSEHKTFGLLTAENQPKPSETLVLQQGGNRTKSAFESQVKVQQTRVKTIHEVCTAHSSFKGSINYNNYRSRYFFSSEYNFAVCGVPKGGSTFWKQALSVIENGPGIAQTMFSKERYQIHNGNNRFSVLKSDRPLTVPSIVVSRDPFSRLFSAYIDKIYLPPPMIKPFKQRCPAEVSFQEFLDFVVSKAGNRLDQHWAPIMSLCRPCDGNVVALIKQESFSTDVTYILEAFKVESKIKEKILEALYSKNIEYTIPSLTRTYFHHASSRYIFRCIGAKEFAKRVWTSFQIQGYLKDTVAFPDNLHENSLGNSTFVARLIVDNIRAHPMSVNEHKLQRKSALVNAYRGVKATTISQIQHLYQADFELFGYNPETPAGE